MSCQVDVWVCNLRTDVEVYCDRHGVLGVVRTREVAFALRDAHMSTGGAPVETGPDASPDTMVSSLDICGDVASLPPGEPEMCRRPSGHHGAHVARPSNPAESMWWCR